ncbi:MAG: SpoIID/LytB domain-containing protein [Lepagella sp.]
MRQEPEIRVGIITDGKPEVRPTADGVMVSNMLIGEGFHWQQKIPARLPGRIETIDGGNQIVNIVPMERYLEAVIGSEMSADAPIEFLKAHAVISRSWAMRKLLDECDERDEYNEYDEYDEYNEYDEYDERDEREILRWEESDSHHGFDVCSDDHCQRYQGLPECGNSQTSEAITATRGEVLLDRRGEIADARFSKCCGGMTEHFSSCWRDEDFDYLPGQKDEWCDLSDMPEGEREQFLRSILKGYDQATRDYHDWSVTVRKSDIAANLRRQYNINVGKVSKLYPTERGISGRITRLCIEGTADSVVIGKELTIRRLLSENCLYSSWFDAENHGDVFILRGHGWGHGVGLCQIGAARMAYAGKDYREILRFYYPGTEISKIYS